jgi:predicted negative regulator of RcsB-dependent stress response
MISKILTTDHRPLPLITRLRGADACAIFLSLSISKSKEGTVSTTKLTRKEMVAEDPVHESIIRLFAFCRENRSKIGVLIIAAIVVIIAIYGGYQYLGNREVQAQVQLAKGLDYLNATVVSDATDNPYSKGLLPTFRSEKAKYQAAANEFSSAASGFAFGSVSVVARYYLGLSQLQLGQKQEAVKNLESVASDSKSHTVGYLAKKLLASAHSDSGNNKGAQAILEGMIRDSKCDLPKEDLSIQLSRVLVAQGKQAEAIKVLADANNQGNAFGAFKQQVVSELEKLQQGSATGVRQNPLNP